MNFALPKSITCLRTYNRRTLSADLLAGITVGLARQIAILDRSARSQDEAQSEPDSTPGVLHAASHTCSEDAGQAHEPPPSRELHLRRCDQRKSRRDARKLFVRVSAWKSTASRT